MKILYHHRIRSKDGQFVHLDELTSALRAEGHEIVFAGPDIVEQGEFGDDAGLVAWMKLRLPRFVYELLELCYAAFAFARLAGAIRRHRPDCLYERYNLFLPAGVWAKKLFRLPMLLEVNAPLYAERARYGGISLNRVARAVEAYTWRGADLVLPVTQVLASMVRDAGVPPERIRVIPNGINRERFRERPATEAAKRRLQLEGRFVLGFAGFVREWHGLESVLDFMAAVRDDAVHFLVVGDGPARDGLQQRAEAIGVADRFTVTGTVSRDDIAACLAAFDVALQPNVVAYASPLKLFEYLELGKAIVAPDTANIREILTHEDNALLFDPASPEQFEACLNRLRKDDALRQHISRRARETIDERGLTWEHNAQRVVELFAGLGVHDGADGTAGAAAE